MSFYNGFAEALQSVRTALSQNTNINDPQNYSKQIGFLNYLFSSVNPRTINTIMQETSNASKYRPVQIKYTPHKGTGDLVTTDSSITCAKTNQRRDYINTYQPTLIASDKFTLEENWVRETLENGQSLATRLEKEFKEAMRVGRESIDYQLFSKAQGLIGANPAAGVGKDEYYTVNMLKADGTVDPDTFDVIRNHMEDNFMTGEPAIIGLGNARRVFNRWAIGNLNTSGGFDVREIANQFGSVLYKDHWTNTVFGETPSNKALVMYPGLAQFYQYNLYRGDFDRQTPDLAIKGTMPDPILPITWDYKLSYDDDCENGNGLQGAWTGTIFTYFDLFTVPEEAFGEPYGDLVDFNGIVGYEIGQASS